MRLLRLHELSSILLASVFVATGCGPTTAEDDPADVGVLGDTSPSDDGGGLYGSDGFEPGDTECDIPMDVPDGLECSATRPPEGCRSLDDCSDPTEWTKCPDGKAAPTSRLSCDTITPQLISTPTTGACPTEAGGMSVKFTAFHVGRRPVGRDGAEVRGHFWFDVQGESDLVPIDDLTDEQADRVERIVVRPVGTGGFRSSRFADGNLAAPPHRPCTSGQCQADGYMCADPSGKDRADFRRCIRSFDDFSTEPAPVSDLRSRQFFGVLVENGASVQGVFPDPIGSLYYDADGDGSAEVSPSSFSKEIASDADELRKSAMTQLGQYISGYDGGWQAPDDLETHFGLWAIEGAREPKSYTNEAAGSLWTTKPEQMLGAVNAFAEARASDQRANIIEAARHLIDGPFADASLDGAEKTLVLLVDGPPEVTVDADKIGGLQGAISRSDVRIVVVQYDPAIPKDKLRDDPSYFNAQQDGCNGDVDCQSWETCREIHGYHPQRGGQVTRPAGEYRDGTYCMPERDSDGRVGPIQYYGRLTCESDGAYYYRKSNEPLPDLLQYMPAMMDGLWELRPDPSVSLSRGLSAGTPVKIGGTLRVRDPDQQTLEARLGLEGASGGYLDKAAQDNRGVIFTNDE